MAGTLTKVSELTAGTTVRVVFRSSLASRLFGFKVPLKGFGRSFAGNSNTDGIPSQKFRRVFGFNRRDFLAQILANDLVERSLTLEIQSTQPRRGVVYYRMVIPWNQIFKLSKLTLGANPVDEEKEAKLRRQRRRIGVDFFHPFDVFSPVSLIG